MKAPSRELEIQSLADSEQALFIIIPSILALSTLVCQWHFQPLQALT